MSGDGRRAVSASLDQTLKVWDVEKGRELHTLVGHIGAVNGVGVSENGKHAVSASLDQTLKVWDAESGCELHTLVGHSGSVYEVRVSRDGRLAVSASADHTLKVWDVENGLELRTLVGHSSSVYGVGVSRDGRLAVSASEDQTLKVWDVQSGRELHTLVGHMGAVYGVAISGDGRRAVSASEDQTLKVWDVENGCPITAFTCEGLALCCAFASASYVVVGDAGGRVYFLELVEERKELKKTQVVLRKDDIVARTEQAMVVAKKHIFLSYCRDNQAEVSRLRAEFLALGQAVWWDQDIHPGQDWKREIRKAMQEAYAVVLCLSRELAARIDSGVYPEIRDAIAAYRQYAPGSIFLIPVRLSDCEVPKIEIDDVKTLESLQYVDLFPGPQRAAGIKRLLEAVQKVPHRP